MSFLSPFAGLSPFSRPHFVAGGGGGGSTQFVTSNPTGSAGLTGFNNSAGFHFTVGASPITITDLAMWVSAGNNQSHAIELRDNSNTLLATVTVNSSGASVGWLYGSITPVILSAATAYKVGVVATVSDAWYDDQVYTSTADATIDGLMFANTNVANVAGHAYYPTNFKYHL